MSNPPSSAVATFLVPMLVPMHQIMWVALVLMYCFLLLDSPVQSSPKPVLSDPPVHSDLLNKVGVKIKHKWREIGLQLQVSNADILAISMSSQIPLLCFSEVLEKWRTKGSPPYTWITMIAALRAPVVDEIALANDIDNLHTST